MSYVPGVLPGCTGSGAAVLGLQREFLVISVARLPAPWVPVSGFGLVSVPPPRWELAATPADEADVAHQAKEAGPEPVC